MTDTLRPLRKCAPVDVRGIAEHKARARFMLARQSLGLSQLAMAQRLGCNVSSVEDWERAQCRVPAWALVEAESAVMRVAKKVGGT